MRRQGGAGRRQNLLPTPPPQATRQAAVPERLDPAIEAAAYFLTSEALTNVAKYAQASSVTVDVATADHTLVVTIDDDGIGGADPGRGSGLRGLVDRVEAVGGHLEIKSPPGEGTRLCGRLPLNVLGSLTARPTPGVSA